MPNARSLPRLLLVAACWVVLALVAGPPDAAAANWRDLTGRVAPDLVFQETSNGLAAGSRISSYRGRQVVLLAFWLRDCPHCEREMGKLEEMHRRWGRAGLQVISVVHKFSLAEVLIVMRKRGWSFPVARDTAGKLAAVYGGGRRPGYFIIGVDGRVKSSNGMPAAVLQTELGRWRLHELGPVPPELNAARVLVYRDDYGAALRSAEAVGAAQGARAEVRAAVAQLAEVARRKLQIDVDRAVAFYRQGYVKAARRLYGTMVTTYAGTSLAGRARALRDAFVARIGGQ